MKPLVANKKKRIVLQGFNLLTRIFFLPKRWKKKAVNVSELSPKKILLIRLDYLGDTVMTTPAFTLLRQRYPDTRIDLLTNSLAAQLFHNDGRINKIYTFNWPWGHMRANRGFSRAKIVELLGLLSILRKERYDIAVDFRGDIRFLVLFGALIGAKIKLSNSRSGNTDIPDQISAYETSKHEVERTLDVIRCLLPIPELVKPEIMLRPAQERDAVQLVERVTGESFSPTSVIVAPYSSKDIKSWPVEYFEVLISFIARFRPVLVVGTKEDEDSAAALVRNCGKGVFNLAGQTTVVQLAAITKQCSLVVGVDTGVLHLASCFSTPIVAIFGPTRSMEYKPYSVYSHVVESGSCSCDQFTHATCDRLVNGYAGCMRDLKPEAVVDAVKSVISS